MLAFKLAFKNLVSAGLRTWLNVIVLSLSFFMIIFYNGMIDGWNQQAKKDTKDWEIGGGQLWQANYDPYDPYTLEDAHAALPQSYREQVAANTVCPILITQATVYPEGRMQSVLLKGIDPAQKVLALPTVSLNAESKEIPIMIGKRMARTLRMKKNDLVLVRWRDVNGTFDATEMRIVEVFDNDVPMVDNGQIWINLETLQEITGMPGEATMMVVQQTDEPKATNGWKVRTNAQLTYEMDQIIQSKKGGASVIYLLLMFIALLAIFDTQVLSIFRRQKEIGTYIALGMTRGQVVSLFTIEGAAHSIFAVIVGSIYGVPLFMYMAKEGFAMPEGTDDYGLAIAEKIFPVYGIGLVIGTTIFIILAATIVSYLPARKISKMRPTDALKGKLQ